MKQILALLLLMSLAASPTLIDRDDYSYTSQQVDGVERFAILQDDTKNPLYLIDPDEQNGSLVSDAAYRTVGMLEAQHDLELITFLAEDAKTVITKAVLADDPEYDVALIPARDTVPLMTQGFTYNLNDNFGIEFDKPWWSGSEALCFNGKQFAAAGDLSLSGFGKSYVLSYTDRSLDQSLYKLVSRGKWTIDEMHRMIKKETASIDGEGTAIALLAGIGQATVSKNADGVLAMQLTTEFLDAADKIALLFEESNAYVQNGALFTLKTIEAVGTDGFVPLPKLDSDEETYRTVRADDSLLFMMPITNRDPNASAKLADELCYLTWEHVTPAYMEEIASHCAGEGASEAFRNMLGYIEASRTIDFADIAGISKKLNQQINECLTSGDAGVTSILVMQDAAVNAYIQEVTGNLY